MEAHSRTLIKICGITTAADAELVAASGADALGLNFFNRSLRRVDTPVAAEIATAVGDRLVRVGLFVDPTADFVDQVLAQVNLDLLQFQGDETAEFCGSFGLPYMKAHRVSGPLDIRALEASYADACCQMLDAYVEGQAGGTGQRFDWSAWPQDARMPLVLAGGLTPGNVESAVVQLHPYAVDVCGGVESSQKGVKDPAAIDEFVVAVRRADAQTE